MRLSSAEGGIHVESVVVAATKAPFSVFLEWVLDSRWRTRSCSTEKLWRHRLPKVPPAITCIINRVTNVADDPINSKCMCSNNLLEFDR